MKLIATLGAVVLLTAHADAQDLSTADFSHAISIATSLSGFPPLPAGSISQGEVEGDGWGHTNLSGDIKIKVDTAKIAREMGADTAAELKALTIVVIHHELHHANGVCDDPIDDDGWESGEASQDACEHVAIYVADLGVTCALAAAAAAGGHDDARAMLCELRESDLAALESPEGDLNAIYEKCLAAQSASPPGYVPPGEDLELPSPLPTCEWCE